MKEQAKELITEAILWVYKHARASIFAVSFFILLFLSNYIPLFGLARYDFLFLSALLIQFLLVVFKMETKEEVKIIFYFHIIGLMLELFKTSPGIESWVYPEDAFFKIATVPLYSGFMYSAVASFITQAWKQLKLRLVDYPIYKYSVPLSIAIYVNFFTHHFIFDFRWLLTILVILIFWKTRVYFTTYKKERSMKLLFTFILIGFFIWIAENISTYFGAWQYPGQIDGWALVGLGKISSWSLLVIISFIIVADLQHLRKRRRKT